MKVNVCIGEFDEVYDLIYAEDILFWEAALDDENGHILKNLILQPKYGSNNDIINIECSRCRDDLHLIQKEDIFYSEDTQNTFDAKMVPYFYDIDENGYASIKDEVVELLIKEMNNVLYDFFNEDDNE